MNRRTEITLEDLKKKKIQIGFVGENLYRQVRFLCDEIYAEHPHAAAALTVVPPEGSAYPAVLERVGNDVVWNITDSDLIKNGDGEIQLSFVDDEMVGKTYIGSIEIHRSLTPSGDVPEGIDDFLTRAGAALTAIPETIDAALEEAKESGEFDGPQGPPGEDGKDGRDGVDGKDGKDGAPGRDGMDGKDGTDGQDGQDGTDAYVWIRYAAAQPTADADMKTTPDAWIGIYSGDSATAPAHYTDYTWYKIKGDTGAVQDVQINGTSILGAGGVANFPYASSDPGVIKIAGYGLTRNNDGVIQVQRGTAAEVKDGTNTNKPIVPVSQHEAAFYGLAKLAGADMKDSSNPVGQYTDAAKVAIQKMLGIYEAPWELIREDTVTNAAEADIEITVDEYGEPFELTDAIVIFYTPVQETASGRGDYGRIRFFYDSSNSDNVWTNTYTQAANASENVSYGIITQENGMIFKRSMNKTSRSGSGSIIMYATDLDASVSGFPFILAKRTYSKINIRAVTGTAHYIIYGRRKWTA